MAKPKKANDQTEFGLTNGDMQPRIVETITIKFTLNKTRLRKLFFFKVAENYEYKNR